MLEQSLLEISGATCFSGVNLADHIQAYLLNGGNLSDPTYREKFYAKCILQLGEDLDRDYPRRYRINDMHMALRFVFPADMFVGHASANLPILDSLFLQLFVESGDLIHYRDDQVQAYARSATRLDPALIVGWRIAKRIREYPSLTCNDLVRIINTQSPFFSPPPTKGSAYAENHVHLNGVHYDGLILFSTLPKSLEEPSFESFKKLQMLAQELLRETDTEKTSGDENIVKICKNVFNGTLREAGAVSWDWLASYQPEKEEPTNLRWLRKNIGVSLIEGNTSSAWLWFVVWCWTEYQSKTCGHKRRMAVFLLFNMLMRIRRQLIMDGLGLTRFVKVYNNDLRFQGKDRNRLVDAAKKIFQGDDDVAELKVVQSQFSPERVATWLEHLRLATDFPTLSSIQPIPTELQVLSRKSFERWHFCIHFLRSKRMLNKPQMAWAEAEKLARRMAATSGWDREDLMPTSSHWKGRLRPANWIRSIDVAGDENELKTEIYAAPIRWLRSGLQCGDDKQPTFPGLYLSIHAGEDFAHPLSGMRHIDETVRFCEMRAGDRLGHALALGIFPKSWLRQHGQSVMLLDDYFDNLVWAWHYACEMSTHLALASQLVVKFERTIHSLLPFVSWMRGWNKIGDVRIDDLFKAWLLRKNCYHYAPNDGEQPLKDRKSDIAVPDLHSFLGDSPSMAVRLYRRRWQSLTGQELGPAKSKALHAESAIAQPVHICIHQSDFNHDLHCNHDVGLGVITIMETAAEVDFIQALQDWLLERYDNRGLIIEVNPTSNVYIGRFNSYAEHPIFRWSPPDEKTLEVGATNNVFGLRNGPIKLCINTDDPGIMPTSLRTEFSLIREAALEHGVSRTNAENWLERIRLFGLAQFQQKHESLWK